MKLDDLRAKLRASGTASASASVAASKRIYVCAACGARFEAEPTPSSCPSCHSSLVAPSTIERAPRTIERFDVGDPWRAHAKERLRKAAAHSEADEIRSWFTAVSTCPRCGKTGTLERDRDMLAGTSWVRCVSCRARCEADQSALEDLGLPR